MPCRPSDSAVTLLYYALTFEGHAIHPTEPDLQVALDLVVVVMMRAWPKELGPWGRAAG